METSVYDKVKITTYTIPTEPCPYVKHGPRDTAADRADTNAIHKEDSRIYNPDKNVNATLKQDKVVAVEETYLSAKKQQYMGFHGVSAKVPRGPPDGEIWLNSYVRPQSLQTGPSGANQGVPPDRYVLPTGGRRDPVRIGR